MFVRNEIKIDLLLGYVMGTDIDYLMLHGKTKPTRVKQKVTLASESSNNWNPIDIDVNPNAHCHFPYTFSGACEGRIDSNKFEAIQL